MTSPSPASGFRLRLCGQQHQGAGRREPHYEPLGSGQRVERRPCGPDGVLPPTPWFATPRRWRLPASTEITGDSASVGYIDRDESGEPLGRFHEWGAQNLLCEKCPILSDSEIEDSIRRIQRALNAEGITSHEDILGEGGEHVFRGTWGTCPIHIYEKMAERGELTARVSINYFFRHRRARRAMTPLSAAPSASRTASLNSRTETGSRATPSNSSSTWAAPPGSVRRPA